MEEQDLCKLATSLLSRFRSQLLSVTGANHPFGLAVGSAALAGSAVAAAAPKCSVFLFGALGASLCSRLVASCPGSRGTERLPVCDLGAPSESVSDPVVGSSLQHTTRLLEPIIGRARGALGHGAWPWTPACAQPQTPMSQSLEMQRCACHGGPIWASRAVFDEACTTQRPGCSVTIVAAGAAFESRRDYLAVARDQSAARQTRRLHHDSEHGPNPSGRCWLVALALKFESSLGRLSTGDYHAARRQTGGRTAKGSSYYHSWHG